MSKLTSILLFLFLYTNDGCQVHSLHFPGLDVLRPFAGPSVQERAAYDLIKRLFGPEYQNQFNLTLDPTLIGDNSDAVMIDRAPGEKIKITAGSGVGLAWGINHFLRNCCRVHVSWDGNQVDLPPVLPHPAARETHHSIGRFRYYANVCAFSYSFAWWNWTQWENHLDWLSLNGVNLPLASVGMEAIWKRVYTKLGLTQQEIDAYFSGPAFLAWRRMGNLKAWGGPLSEHWHSMQSDLQRKILSRMVDLGMVPVLPTFAGHVPDAVQRLYPNASISVLHWLGFNCSYSCVRFLEPTDPLFEKIGTMFMTEMKQEYGLYHAYSADPFNEMRPRSYAKEYLDAIGKAIYRSMTNVDPEAVWVMQGWMFINDASWSRYNDSVRSFLSSVPRGKMLVLDLYSEQVPVYRTFNSYYGQPFVWNMLHNFGGVNGLFGAVTKINEYMWKAAQDSNSTLVGAGLTMEGIYQNYPLYQFALDRMWAPRREKINQTNWIRHYARQRYGGGYDEDLQNAWRLLWTTVYDQFSTPIWHSKLTALTATESIQQNAKRTYISSLSKRPSLHMDTQPSYDTQALCTAWKYFVHRSSSSSYRNSSLFRLDLVDLTREVLVLVAGDKYRLLVKAYWKNDSRAVTEYGSQLLRVFDDLQDILATHRHFLLGRWIRDARAKGITDEENDLYEYNLRNQITLWGPNGEILDYARKEWAGLISDYVKPRWLLFVNMLLESLGAGTFSQRTYEKLVFATVEEPFTFSKATVPSIPIGDSVRVAKRLFDTYFAACQAVSKDDHFL